MGPEKRREIRLGRATLSASECRPATSLNSTTSRFTTLGIHRDRTSHPATGGRTTTCTCDPAEGTGGRVGCDLFETGPETFRRLEVCTLTTLLDPKASDAGSGDQEQDHDVDHALPPKTCLLLPRCASFAVLACERDAFTARCFRLTEAPMTTVRRSIHIFGSQTVAPATSALRRDVFSRFSRSRAPRVPLLRPTHPW